MLEFMFAQEKTTIFVAHNLEYDTINLFKKHDYIMVEKMIFASKLLKVTMYGTTHYFLNSNCFYLGNVKSMGDFVGLEKLEGNALSPKYCLRDAEIVYKFMYNFQKKANTQFGVNLGLTLGQMCMQSFRRDFMLSNKQITYNSENCLKAYYGGRVEVGFKGPLHNMWVFDINSSYPDAMRNNFFADTSTIVPSTIKTHKYGIGKFKVHVTENTMFPVLPHRHKKTGRLYFPVGTFTGWWSYREMRYAMKHGTTIIEEYEGEGTNTGIRPFKKFVDTFYPMREKVKEILEKDPDNIEAKFDDLLLKLWLNNLYGKFCQHQDGNEMRQDPLPDEDLERLRKDPNFKESKLGRFYNYHIPRENWPKTANFMWGLDVTVLGRIKLHEMIFAIHKAGGTVAYYDTDSVFASGIKKPPMKLSNKLGDWDCERYDLGVFRQAKGYLLLDKKGDEYEIKKFACKGVPSHFHYEFLIDGIAETYEYMENDKKILKEFVKPNRLKQALIRQSATANMGETDKFLQEIGANFWKQVSKAAKSIDIKRLTKNGKDGLTFPVNIKDIPKNESNRIQKDYKSIKNHLEKQGIYIIKPPHKNPFTATTVPKDWFVNEPPSITNPGLYTSQKAYYLNTRDLLSLNKNDLWFSGHVLKKIDIKGRAYYMVLIDKYKNETCPINFWGRISVKMVKAFIAKKDLTNKYIEIHVNNKYFKNSKYPSLQARFYGSKYEGQFDPIESKVNSELSENEIKTFMSLKTEHIQ